MTETQFINALGDADPWAELDPAPNEQQAGPIDTDALAKRFPRINWEEAFAKDFSEVEWLPGRFMERGQQAALVGGGKVGKSLFVHYWIWCLVTGRRFLSDSRYPPLRVLYFDRENNLRDIITRMISFGAVPRELEGLDYRLFPSFSGALDESAMAVAELLCLVDESKPDVVIFDTVSRFIGGKENDADTWLSFYRRVHAPLKERGIAGVRLDHMGKDEERGSRGSSAKAQDVDHVWELTRADEHTKTDREHGFETITTNLRLYRTHSRTGLGQDLFWITRRARREQGGGWLPGDTSHELTDSQELNAHHATVMRYVDALAAAGAPTDLGRDRLREWAATNGVELPGKAAALGDVVRAYKASKAA